MGKAGLPASGLGALTAGTARFTFDARSGQVPQAKAPCRQVKEGYSKSYAYVLLHRLRKDGAAVSSGPGRVRLLAPGNRVQPKAGPEAPWLGALRRRFTVKETGFSVLPKRYGVPQPHELLLPPSQVNDAAAMLQRNHPELQVSRDAFQGGGDVVCL